MAVIQMKQLLEAGVHFGHQTRRWNPKMAPYIFTARNGIYIIDLQKTSDLIDGVYEEIRKIALNGGKILFVGTKKQAQEAIKEDAARSGQYYVTTRWLGGMLTNFRTIRSRVARLLQLEKMAEDGTFDMLTKKEVQKLNLEKEKLDKYLGGIRDMEKLPQAVFVVDPKSETIAVREARRLNIPVFGIVDTNCDPDDVDYIIPANDDAIRSVKLITETLANGIIEATEEYNTKKAEEKAEAEKEPALQPDQEVVLKEVVKKEVKREKIKPQIIEENE